MKGLATMELTADKLQPADSSFPTLVCANFDGASVMMGSKSGVATRIQQSFPWVIPIHCVAHKLELGILDGVKAVKYINVWLSDSELPSMHVTLTLLFEILTFLFGWGEKIHLQINVSVLLL